VKIAIIGGGPAGSFCAIHLLRRAERLNKRIEVVIFDHKNFDRVGPGGCNLCAGVITRSMIENLKQMKVPITAEIIQRRIDGFVFISEGGSLEIKGSPEERFYSVFRGGGPIDHSCPGEESFDYFLLKHAKEMGAVHIEEPVNDISRTGDRSSKITVQYGRDGELHTDVVVGAFGVNSTLTKRFEEMGFGYRAPKVIRVGQAELTLPKEFIDKTYRSRIKIFCLEFPHCDKVKFVALTPKKGYVTASLIGKGVGEEEIKRVFADPRILAHFPQGWQLPQRYCKCFPRLPYQQARKPFSDGIVMIGDAHVSRFYKNGIGSAFNTASWAAENILDHGIRSTDFHDYYYLKCKEFYYGDNRVGRGLFRINDVIAKNRFLARIAVALTRGSKAQNIKEGGVLQQMLWSLFTGDLQYRDIILRALSLKR